jgi:hypothetical protein
VIVLDRPIDRLCSLDRASDSKVRPPVKERSNRNKENLQRVEECNQIRFLLVGEANAEALVIEFDHLV